jgi:hypothetical protein
MRSVTVTQRNAVGCGCESGCANSILMLRGCIRGLGGDGESEYVQLVRDPSVSPAPVHSREAKHEEQFSERERSCRSPVSAKLLECALERLPRVPLGRKPTPLHAFRIATTDALAVRPERLVV